MLSLPPRMDLFKFELPKDFFLENIVEKYDKILNSVPGVITNSIDYVNESIQGITLPGISNLYVEQEQTSHNNIQEEYNIGGKIDVEPTHTNFTTTSQNPLALIDPTITVTFKLNQGLFNYYMIYENIFYLISKPSQFNHLPDIFNINILDRQGYITSRVTLFQPVISGIDGLEFNYAKNERQPDTFNIEFKFNNIDYDFVYYKTI